MSLAVFDQFNHHGGHGPHIPFFLLPALLALAALCLLGGALLLWRRNRGTEDVGPAMAPRPPTPPAPPARYDSPLQTLEDRYVRGEIDQAEFEHRRSVLRGVPPIPVQPDEDDEVATSEIDADEADSFESDADDSDTP